MGVGLLLRVRSLRVVVRGGGREVGGGLLEVEEGGDFLRLPDGRCDVTIERGGFYLSRVR